MINASEVVSASKIRLQEKQIIAAGRSNQVLELIVHSGVIRASGSFNLENSDVTLALFSSGHTIVIKVPSGCMLQLEAITESLLTVKPDSTASPTEDLNRWLIKLHLVRQLIGAEARLIALFQLLVEDFGFRHKDNYSLPFWLSHARLAEIISTSRGTVTRQITYLRKSMDIGIDENQGSLIISSRLMEVKPNQLEAKTSGNKIRQIHN